jgi:proline dehydrogenase
MSCPEAASSLFDSSPPEEPASVSALVKWKRRLTGAVSAAILPIIKKVAGPYVGGDTVDEALCVADRLAAEGFATTLGYWDTGKDSSRQVADLYRNTIQCISQRNRDCYVSLKPPPLRFAPELAGELANAAAAHGLGLHCDSHGVNVVDLSNAMLQAMIGRLGGEHLGTTLPGRWSRSLRDAEWAIERRLNVRVVKGQWPDPDDTRRDISAGFLEVIGHLAGRARHVAVATHDFALAREAIGRLRAAGTPCELELLLGMPAKDLVHWARENSVKTRIYVPFGSGFVPNALGVLKRNPRLVLAIARDRVASAADFLRMALTRNDGL